MDAIEKHFRSRPRNPLAIRHYVQSLVDRRRILEAAFYFKMLQKIDPSSISTNKLGYLISIMRLDGKVAAYDKALNKYGAKEEDILSLRVAYYLAFSKHNHALETAKRLATLRFSNDLGMNGVIQTIEETSDYELTQIFIDRQYRKITVNPKLEQVFKRILILKLLNLISLMPPK